MLPHYQKDRVRPELFDSADPSRYFSGKFSLSVQFLVANTRDYFNHSDNLHEKSTAVAASLFVQLFYWFTNVLLCKPI